jgi:SAM-dependent methyltransferase
MDGMALDLPDMSFDAAISVFGVVLFPDVGAGMREIARVLRPGGRVAIVTWTQPHRYELAARLRQAILAVRGEELPPTGLPAQLRYTDPAALGALLADAGLVLETIQILEESWSIPGARWLGDRIAFAPGMRGMMQGLGELRDAVVDEFVGALEREKGVGPISLAAVAHVAFGRRA